ncbi:MAG: GNAT family N-acetyltransferase [Betaproteobacteria bacterium]|jgi:GNAT superfamily N-acetyltransferase|nr:GNAT family N-acetyltransferase [Betaproteobacteria bacterium]MDH5286090.1 GNAT family N-acetyltransferase [Betaproteobacteria bacterium]
MPDLLVRLYELPDPAAAIARSARAGVTVRRANAWEKRAVVGFVERAFTAGWAAECEVAFGGVPPRCFVAARGGDVLGFACHDTTRLNFFGPAGVAPAEQGKGIGAALTLAALAAMRDAGYAYAIVGGAGPEAFYARVCGATPIAGSTPGIYDLALLRK